MLSAVSPGLGVLILGNSIFEGVGITLLIPPVYILTTLLFGDMKSRAQAFGVISGMGGIGAATGPLIGAAPNPHQEPTSRLQPPDTASERAAAASAGPRVGLQRS